MKKLTLTAMVALALVPTYTQCKKETEKPAATEEKVFVALTATANDGSASATERRPPKDWWRFTESVCRAIANSNESIYYLRQVSPF